MKHITRFPTLFRWLIAMAAGSLASSGFAADRIYAWIVAERNAPARDATSDAPARSSYVLVDGGYIEEGDSVANTRPADPAAVRAALASGLDAAGFNAAAPAEAESIIVYHWGVLRPSTYDRTGYRGLSFNARARIRLVADVRHVERIEQVLEAGIHGVPWYMPSRTRDFLSYARDSRYFLVVSAYDSAAANDGQAVLQWRTKLSVTDNETNMQAALRTLAIEGSDYFGASAEPFSARLTVPAPSSADPNGAAAAPSNAWTSLVEHERKQLLGESLANDYINAFRRQTPIAISEPSLPPELQTRLENYRREKRELQEALAARVAGLGTDERVKAIDAFNREHADAISALSREEWAIRAELSQIAGSSQQDGSAMAERLLDPAAEPASPVEAR